MTPQLIYGALTIFGLLIILRRDGKPQKPYNFWLSLSSTLIGYILLYWGGFWDPLFG